MDTGSKRAAGLAWCAPLLLLWLSLSLAFAQAPEATIERIVDLKVENEEIRSRWSSGEIDGGTASLRRTAINAELRMLYQQIGKLSADAQQQANSRIEGLTKARLATLAPQWQARSAQFKQQQVERDRAAGEALATDVRAALELQRRRLLLQQRRDRGEITPQEFAAEDKKALDDLMAIRGKYERAGGREAEHFDHALELMTQAIAKDPSIPIPVSRVPPGNGGTSADDYQRDVSLARDLNAQGNEVRNRYWGQKDIDPATLRETERILDGDIARLSAKWQAAGRGPDFERDYRSVVPAASAPGQPVGVAVQPPQPFPVEGMAVLILGGIITLSGLIGALWLLSRLFKRTPPRKRAASTVHGSAHYAPLETDIPDEACLANGLFLGKSSTPGQIAAPLEAPGAPVCATPEHHTLIVARTRTGKGTRVIVPTLLRYAGSALVIDPKGENAAITAATRRSQLAQSIHILNPWNELASVFVGRGLAQATYNPLDILDRRDPNAVAIAQTLAGAVCPAPANAKDRFWQGSAANILAAVFLWLADRPNETKTLGRAREIVSLTRKDFRAKFLIPMAASEVFAGAIREMAAPFIDLADETYSGVMSNLSESTKFLSDPQIKAATATSSFAMDDLVTGKATVYVVIPTDRMDTQKTWLRLVIAAGMHRFKHPAAKPPTGHRCLFLIDEFAALGRLDDLPRDIATMSGFGVDFALVVQGLDQLKDHYGEARGTILSNCAYKWFCNVNDLDSAKYLSESLGKATVGATSTSDSSSSGNRNASQSHTTTHSETGRALLNPDEVLNLGKDVAIALQPNGHPHYLKPVDYWNLAEAFVGLSEQFPGLYWDPPILFHENPYVSPPHKITEKEARQILGVAEDAPEEELRDAYNRWLQSSAK